jgi:hypothetical protein
LRISAQRIVLYLDVYAVQTDIAKRNIREPRQREFLAPALEASPQPAERADRFGWPYDASSGSGLP